MKTNRAYIRYIAFLLISAFTCTGALSQGTDSRSMRRKSPEKLYVGINLVPKMAAINYEGFGDSLKIKSGGSFDFSLEAGYFFSENIGVSAGAGLSSFSAKLTLGSYKANYPATDNDTDHESYQMQITGKNITEDQKIGLLSIPFCLNLRYPAGEKIRLFLNAGASINIPVVKSYNGKGTFTYKGYYAAYPVTIENYPKYFPTDYATDTTGTLRVKSMVPGIVASAGASFAISESLQLGLGLYFNKSLGSISEYPDQKFRLTSAKDDLRTFMAAGKTAGIQSIGLTIGLKYFLK